jgi:hypothetical protein
MPSEDLKPISQTDAGTWSGNWANVDEPWGSFDGSTIDTDSWEGDSIKFQMSNLQNWREGIDTLQNIHILVRAKRAIDLDLVTNGTFTTDSDWEKGTGWTIGSGVASHAAGTASFLSQDLPITEGNTYQITFDVANRTAGSVTPGIGLIEGTAVSANSTGIKQTIVTTLGSGLYFSATSDFDGDIDNVLCKEVNASVPEVGIYVKWFINGLEKGIGFYELPNDNTFSNHTFTYPWWDDHLARLTQAQLDTLEVEIQSNFRPSYPTPVLISVDTLTVRIFYDLPPPIVKTPDEGDLGIVTGPPTRLVRYYARPSSGTTLLSPKSLSLFRQNIERPDPRVLFLEQYSPVLATTYFPGKTTLSLAGTPQADYGIPTSDGALALAGKVPTTATTTNHFINIFLRSRLYLQGQEVGDEDSALPSRVRTQLEGQSVSAERSWLSSPDPVVLQVGEPAHYERLWPESWTPGLWSGDVANIDESPDAPDGQVIKINQQSQFCSIEFSDVEIMRDGIDTITGLQPTFRIRSNVADTKLYYYLYVENTLRTTGTLTTTGSGFDTLILPESLWIAYVAGTDIGPINSLKIQLAIFDSGVTMEVDLISLDVTYDRVSPTKPTLNTTIIPAKGTLSLSGRNLEAISSVNAPDPDTLALAGQAPDLFVSLTLDLVGKSPTLDVALPVPGTALALTGKAPLILAVEPDPASLVLSGKGLSLEFATVLTPGDHGIISVSTRRSIEHIATPTDEIEL